MHLVDGVAGAAAVEVRDPSRVVWLSQTTLSVDETLETVDALRERFPLLQSPPSDDICYATQNRQGAVKAIAPDVELFLVVGSANSSNSVRMVEVALAAGAKSAYLVENVDAVEESWLDGVTTVGLSSGASVPEILVREVADWLAARGYGDQREVMHTEERLTFALPQELRRDLRQAAASDPCRYLRMTIRTPATIRTTAVAPAIAGKPYTSQLAAASINSARRLFEPCSRKYNIPAEATA